MNDYLKSAESENSHGLVSSLWLASEVCGARVILNTSEYGIIDAIDQLPGVRRVRFSRERMLAPAPSVLADYLEEFIKQKQLSGLTGNSQQDIELYCQVVGNYRTAKDSLVNGFTVRKAIGDEFKKSVKNVREGVCNLKDSSGPLQSPNHLFLISKILNALCESQKFKVTDDPERKLCRVLAGVNILRPVSSEDESFELHRFSIEVATRALLGKPVGKDHVAAMKAKTNRSCASG